MRHWEPPNSHRDLMQSIQLAHSNGSCRLWRINAGLAWQGRIIEQTERRLVLLDPYAVRLACAGFSDLCGITSITVTADMVGKTVGIFTAIEAKYGRDKPNKDQESFLAMVRQLGGRSGVARSVEESAAILGV